MKNPGLKQAGIFFYCYDLQTPFYNFLILMFLNQTV